MPLIANILKGKNVEMYDERRSDERRVCVLSRKEGTTVYTPGYFSGFDGAPEGSIAQIDLIGPIMKYGYCGDGTYELNQLLQEAKVNPNIKAAFFNIDCPGGQVAGSTVFRNSIKSFGKPTLGFVNDGMMCSMATVIGTACGELYASNPLDQIGCVGVYQTIVDQSEMLKKMGVKVSDRYAPQSTEKNKTYRNAQKGNFDLLDEELFAVAEAVINAVADGRGDRMTGDPEEWNKGQTNGAQWALDIGMIDGICTIEDALARLDQMCDETDSAPITIPSPANSKNSNMKPEEILALAGIENPTEEQLAAANAWLTANNISGVQLATAESIQAAGAVTADRDRLKGELATSSASLATAQAELQTANATISTNATRIAELEAQVEAFGKAGSTKRRGPDGNDTVPDGEKTTAQILDSLPHNQKADKLLGK